MNVPITTKTLARLIVLSVFGFVFAMLVPAPADMYAPVIHLGTSVIVGATLVLLIAQATQRRQQILESVRVELNKLRRVYHIAKNLSVANPDRYRVWFTELHGHLLGYLSFFSGKTFDQYDESNAAFRKVSYHVYTVPDLASEKEEALYQDLLSTTATVAEARQQIKELWDNRHSAYVWTAILLMAVGFLTGTVLSMGDSMAGRIAGGISIVVVFLVIDLLWEVDTLTTERKALAARYVNNVSKLELKRE